MSLQASSQTGHPCTNQSNYDYAGPGSQPIDCSFLVSADSNRITEKAPSPKKRRRVLPQHLDDQYGNWIPCGDIANEDEEPVHIPVVAGDVPAKQKRYASSVHFYPSCGF